MSMMTTSGVLTVDPHGELTVDPHGVLTVDPHGGLVGGLVEELAVVQEGAVGLWEQVGQV